MYSFPLTNGMVIQITQSGVAMDQLCVNRWDVVIANVGGGPNAALLTTSLQALWAAQIAPLMSDKYIHVRTRLQVVTDVISTIKGPRRVFGALYSVGPTGSQDGTDGANALPYDAAMSIVLQTTLSPRATYGSKRFSPISVNNVLADGETVEPTQYAAWQAAADAVFLGPKLVSAGPTTYEACVIPAAQIAALPLPHAPLNTLVNDIVGTIPGYYVGSQASRRITPFSTRGH